MHMSKTLTSNLVGVQQSSYELQEIDTNELNRNVLLFNKNTYLIPSRSSILLKRIKQVEMANGLVSIAYTHLVWFNIKGLPQQIKEKLNGETPIKYRINQDDTEGFTKENSNIRTSNDIVTITYRGETQLPLFGDIRLAPFSTFKMEFVFELTHFELDFDDKHFIVRFNILTSRNAVDGEKMMFIKLEAQRGAEYTIDNSYLQIEFPAEQKKDKSNPANNLTYYPTCSFIFRIYRQPIVPMLTAYIPMLFLAFIILTVLDGANDLNAKTANIAVVALAYISFIPALRQAIPPSEQLTLGDVVLYSNLLGCSLVLLQSYIFFTKGSGQAAWAEENIKIMNQVTFILASIFLFAPYLFLFILSLIFICIWEKKYDIQRTEAQKQAADTNTFSDEWVLPNDGKVAQREKISILV